MSSTEKQDKDFQLHGIVIALKILAQKVLKLERKQQKFPNIDELLEIKQKMMDMKFLMETEYEKFGKLRCMHGMVKQDIKEIQNDVMSEYRTVLEHFTELTNLANTATERFIELTNQQEENLFNESSDEDQEDPCSNHEEFEEMAV
jgi:hypothetical protein